MSQLWEMGDALRALQCALLALVGRNDEVLLVDHADALSTLATKFTRTHARSVTSAEVFDAMGEHTRALLLIDPSEAQLELAAFELPLILVLHRAPDAPLDEALMRVEVRVEHRRCTLQAAGLSPVVQQALERLIHDCNEVRGFPQ